MNPRIFSDEMWGYLEELQENRALAVVDYESEDATTSRFSTQHMDTNLDQQSSDGEVSFTSHVLFPQPYCWSKWLSLAQ